MAIESAIPVVRAFAILHLMATSQFTLGPTPPDGRPLDLWIQHLAGFIVFEDVRGYALSRMDPDLGQQARVAAVKAVDDAVYGLMMILDGVTGAVRDDGRRVELDCVVRLVDQAETVYELALSQGDGMSTRYHGWIDGDFGDRPVVMDGDGADGLNRR